VRTTATLAAGETVVPDLTFIAGGDPILSGRALPYSPLPNRSDPLAVVAKLADYVAAIKQIDGNLVADDSRYPYEPYPDGCGRRGS
jgi:D-alanyl-D-alanine carboxypeptidase/D-alanyl-D-alanine-endopeptidase (penicillin-binding protein 4)